ncbi:two-component sensor histidine kinase [Planobispora rosea]|uniref:histidine kinase n=1 Tax=Planobispora rosea TaxID=35762 RepID=A0A8J3WGH5_PLARO|nr:histidine kinase [Planobispora rosea]GGT02400.1 two-component sensor histidine kinase [Planobispora rosea]GIH88550.1 two-component sensor histidine kinase [Planobispora rosea]
MGRFPFIARIRALPPLLLDVALAVVVLVAQSVPFLYETRRLSDEPWTVAHYLPVLASALPLVARRRYPFTVLVLTLLAAGAYSLNDPDNPSQPIWYGMLVAVYTVAERSSWRRGIAATAIVIGGSPLVVGSVPTFVRGMVTWIAAYAIGRAVAVHRASAAALQERAVRLEREREIEAERAAERERARIARDMHDILAHAVSIMVVQAEAGPLAVRANPERAEAAFDAIGSAGREAMAQLRRMLGLLKEAEGSRDPQPTLDRIPELVGQVGRSGPRVALTVTGTPAGLPADAEVAAYRIVQESLTNIVKHARATTAEVRLEWKDDALVIDITDDGTGPAPADRPREPALSGGDGLIGIRERATACGGTASFGPDPGAHGFRVSVRLPLSPPAGTSVRLQPAQLAEVTR